MKTSDRVRLLGVAIVPVPQVQTPPEIDAFAREHSQGTGTRSLPTAGTPDNSNGESEVRTLGGPGRSRYSKPLGPVANLAASAIMGMVAQLAELVERRYPGSIPGHSH